MACNWSLFQGAVFLSVEVGAENESRHAGHELLGRVEVGVDCHRETPHLTESSCARSGYVWQRNQWRRAAALPSGRAVEGQKARRRIDAGERRDVHAG